MARIDLPEGLPGILGPMAFRPELAVALNQLAEALLRTDEGLTRGERELIAASVSAGNECRFCAASHAAFSARQIDGGYDVVDPALADPASAPISPKLAALLRVAEHVRQSGLAVTDEDVAAARAEGATDLEIHDTVLIAAAFCMFNRYVDGLGTWAPTERSDYDAIAVGIVERGYAASSPRPD
jgi:uncharacterized peroxidase-related enzyme